MSLSQMIMPHLPYLRRFARALTGDQTSGDNFAGATLEAIVTDPACFNMDLDARLALYKVFLKVWVPNLFDKAGNEANMDPADSATGTARSGLQKLASLTSLSRVAFLLSAVEGFSVEQIATALGCPVAEAVDLLEEAGRELAAQIATEVLIIEDEPLIAIDIEALVESLGHKVIEVARTHREAIEAVQRKRPGLILADIQLADGSSGLDAVNDILNGFEVPVIFITAFPERLLTGVRPEPAFLISKPFRPDMVKAVISQALFFDQRSASATVKLPTA